HHNEFYFDDGNLLIGKDCPDGLLYRVYIGILQRCSDFFNGMLSLPRSEKMDVAVRAEGSSDEHPVRLALPHSIERNDLDNTFSYIFSGYDCESVSILEAFFISLIKVASFYDMPKVLQYATMQIEQMGTIKPALQLEIARIFRVDSWVEPAFRKLLLIPSLSITEGRQIGIEATVLYAETQKQIKKVRQAVAASLPPLLQAPGCTTLDACTYAWMHEWKGNVRQLYNHPDNPLFTTSEMLYTLRTTPIENLCSGCQDATVTWLYGKGLMAPEEVHIAAAVAELMAFQTDEPIRAALRESVKYMDVEQS
ncbi:hypothetical protein C8F01DRAFT_983230, partial [Mycena amicta]